MLTFLPFYTKTHVRNGLLGIRHARYRVKWHCWIDLIECEVRLLLNRVPGIQVTLYFLLPGQSKQREPKDRTRVRDLKTVSGTAYM